MTHTPRLPAQDPSATTHSHIAVGGDGAWRVETETATYVLDLDQRLAWRHPRHSARAAGGPGHAPVATLRRDGEPIPLLAMARCVIGEPMQLVLDVRGDGILTIRATTPVVRIERCPTTTTDEDREGPDDR